MFDRTSGRFAPSLSGRFAPSHAVRLLVRRTNRRSIARLLLVALAAACGWALPAAAQTIEPEPVVHKIQGATERMEMIVNSSRMLTLDQKIPRAQVNNREILELTPLSPNEIQVSAKKPGVTQINLWNESGQVHSIDVIVYGDARELSMLLQTEFPHATVKVRPLANSVWLSGFVDRPEDASKIIRLAEDYYPKVMSNISVGGVQQILLHVTVAEVSRTKLRTLGIDWSSTNGSDFFVSSVSGLIDAAAASAGTAGAGGDTMRFGVIGQNTTFNAFIEALRRHDLMKILACPTLTTVSGRPAFFNSGGEFPVLIPQSLGTVSIEYKKFGTQVDFVPIVLGNGHIRLEVRPRISEIDNTRSVEVGGTTIPGLRVREVDTGVEMRAGQTLALAGLVQERVETENSGIPWIADLPYFGAPFRKVRTVTNEVELLILVTPELVDAIDACDVPPCLPGMGTTQPNDWQLYMRGHTEVPSCGPCGTTGGGLPFGPGGEHGIEALPPPSNDPNNPPEPAIDGASAARRAQMLRGNGWTRDTSAGSGYPRAYATTPARARGTAPAAEGTRPSARRYNPSNAQEPAGDKPPVPAGSDPGFIGPVGYDVLE